MNFGVLRQMYLPLSGIPMITLAVLLMTLAGIGIYTGARTPLPGLLWILLGLLGTVIAEHYATPVLVGTVIDEHYATPGLAVMSSKKFLMSIALPAVAMCSRVLLLAGFLAILYRYTLSEKV